MIQFKAKCSSKTHVSLTRSVAQDGRLLHAFAKYLKVLIVIAPLPKSKLQYKKFVKKINLNYW